MGQGPICRGDWHPSGVSINLTLASVFPKAGAGARCPAEVLAGDVAAVEVGKHKELQQFPDPNARYSNTYCWQYGHVDLLIFEENSWCRQLEKLQPLLLVTCECMNSAICQLSMRTEGRPREMPAVSPVEWKSLPSAF